MICQSHLLLLRFHCLLSIYSHDGQLVLHVAGAGGCRKLK